MQRQADECMSPDQLQVAEATMERAEVQAQPIGEACPQCGHEIEMFSTDTEARCEHCGFVAYNDTLSCVQWCKYARQCVGDEMYEQMMQIAAKQKEEAAALRKQRREASK